MSEQQEKLTPDVAEEEVLAEDATAETVDDTAEDVIEEAPAAEAEEEAAEEADEDEDEDEDLSTLFSAPPAPPKQKVGKKRLRGFFITLCVMLFLGGAVAGAYCGGLFSETEDTSDTSSEESEVHLDSLVDYSETGTSAIEKISIQNETGSYTLSPDDTGAMAVEGYFDLPRDSDAVDELLVQYTAVTPDLVIAENATEEEIAACGLDEPSITVTTTYQDGKTLTVLYGRLASGGESGYYGMEQGGTTLWLFEEEYYQTVMNDYTQFLGKTLMTAPSPNSDDSVGSAKLKKLVLSGGSRDTAVTMRYIEPEDDESLQLCGNFVIEEPYLHAADSDVVSDWDTSLCGLYGASIEAVHPTDKELVSFGLDSPRAVATLTFGIYISTDEDGNDLETPTWYNETDYTITIGSRTEDDTYYAMIEGIDVVYTVNASTIPWVELSYEDLANKSLFLRYITDITSIYAQVDGTSYTLKLTHGTVKDESGNETATLSSTLNGSEKDEASVRGLYQTMMTVKRVSAAPADATASGTPILSLRLTPKDGAAETSFSFYPYSANRYLCVGGDGDRFLVKVADIESVTTQWTSLAALTDEDEE